MGAIIIIDAFWGDAGKGKFSYYLTKRLNASICVRAGIGSNAGHSVFKDGEKIRTRLLPMGFSNPSAALMIGSGVVVDPKILLNEIEELNIQNRIIVDYRCSIVDESHILREKESKNLHSVGSTFSGSGEARVDRIRRIGKTAKDIPELKKYLGDVALEVNTACGKGEKVVVETSQATFLSLYLSDRYPFVTSDNCITTSFADDIGLNWKYIDDVLLLVKTLPTSVGNGPLPNEMTFEDIKSKGLEEFGTNTNRPRRRVNEIPMDLLKYAVMLNGPTQIALTYCDQYDKSFENRQDITDEIHKLISYIQNETQIMVKYLENGKEFDKIIEI